MTNEKKFKVKINEQKILDINMKNNKKISGKCTMTMMFDAFIGCGRLFVA